MNIRTKTIFVRISSDHRVTNLSIDVPASIPLHYGLACNIIRELQPTQTFRPNDILMFCSSDPFDQNFNFLLTRRGHTEISDEEACLLHIPEVVDFDTLIYIRTEIDPPTQLLIAGLVKDFLRSDRDHIEEYIDSDLWCQAAEVHRDYKHDPDYDEMCRSAEDARRTFTAFVERHRVIID